MTDETEFPETTEFLSNYMRATKLVRALADGSVRRRGLHLGQNLVLAALDRRDGQTPGELAASLNVTTPTITKMATRMATAGLLTRRRDDRDNRLVRLWLTDTGQGLCAPLEADRSAMWEELLTGFTDEDRATLADLLGRLADNAARMHDGPVDHG